MKKLFAGPVLLLLLACSKTKPEPVHPSAQPKDTEEVVLVPVKGLH